MPASLDRAKLRLLDFAGGKLGMRSFADLGGVWNVEAGYTFYGASKPGVERAVLVDTDLPDAVANKLAQHPKIEVIQGNFGDPGVAERVTGIDAALFFDTLLHQVSPDWDQVLEMYAGRFRLFVIFNQQYTASRVSIRLLDLPRDEYFRSVPHSTNDEVYKTAFECPDAIHPRHGRRWRDVHHIWQWGITDDDLVAKMKSLGYGIRYYRNHGRFGELPFENHGFVFASKPAHYYFAINSNLRYGAARVARRIRTAASSSPHRV